VLLSDPSRATIEALGLHNPTDPRHIARTATRLLAPDGRVAWADTGGDFADRPHEDGLLAALAALGLDPVRPEPVPRGALDGPERPGVLTLAELAVYFRAVRFAAIALGGRMTEPGDRAAAERLRELAERYGERVKQARELAGEAS
jgi:hypothetical protein